MVVNGEIGPKIDHYMIDRDFTRMGYTNARVFSCEVSKLRLTGQALVSVHFVDSGDRLDNGDPFVLDATSLEPLSATQRLGETPSAPELSTAVAELKSCIGAISTELRAGFAWLEPRLTALSTGLLPNGDDPLVSAAFALLEQSMRLEENAQDIDSGRSRPSIAASLQEIKARITEASAIATAAVTCANNGSEREAIRLSLDLGHVLQEAQILHRAVAILGRLKNSNAS
jgi:hypothetical protein